VRRLGRLLLGAPPALEAGRNRRNPQAVTCAASQAIGGGPPAPPRPASIRCQRPTRQSALVLQAEALGYDSTLVAQHTINPHDQALDQLEAWTASAALAGLTNRIEIITAIKPYLYHPVVLAKMALQIENISRGRFAINLVNAWNRPELEKAGIGFAEHDERYAYGREWISVVKPLTGGERVSFTGRHFNVDDYELLPHDQYRARPTIYLGGESEPARALAADHADVWFINGQPLDDVNQLIADVSSRPRHGAPLRFGLSAFVIARDSHEEAMRHAGVFSISLQKMRRCARFRSSILIPRW
jgi:alkanesulfonate monooxygenase